MKRFIVELVSFRSTVPDPLSQKNCEAASGEAGDGELRNPARSAIAIVLLDEVFQF
jgi:hypothetical protein